MSKQRIYIFIIFVALLLAKPSFSLASFPDVVQDTWYSEHVNNLAEYQYINGFNDGLFGPQKPLTRENSARLIGRWFLKEGVRIPEDSLNVKRFYDIPTSKDSELVQLTAMLAEEGIILGSEGNFKGSHLLTRGQMALLLSRSIDYLYQMNIMNIVNETSFKSQIIDIDNVSTEVQNAIIALEYYGITENKKFEPNKPVTRAEFATFLGRTIELFGELKHSPDMIQLNIAQEPNYQKYFIPKGTMFYGSKNLKRITATSEQDLFITMAKDGEEPILYAEIGLERFYIPIESAIKQSNTEPPVVQSSFGIIRLPKDSKLFMDFELSNAVITLQQETSFRIVDLQENVVTLYANGIYYYANFNDRITYPKLPYKILNDTTLVSKQNHDDAIGTVGKGYTIFAESYSKGKFSIIDSSQQYLISEEDVIEVEEKVVYDMKYKDMSVPVYMKENIELYTLDNQYVGSINAGKSLLLTNTDSTFGYGIYANIPVQFPLEEIYHTNLINSNQMITYESMVQQLKQIHALYPTFTKLEIIGKTVEGRDIYALKLGNGAREIVMDASMHAREYLTTNVLMEMIDTYSEAYARGEVYEGYDVQKVLNTTSIWFIPMVNADGVSLVQKGVNSTKYKDSIIKINKGDNVNRWKANIRGIDLNRNFDGNWKDAVSANAPNWYNFKGYSVFSEPESKALKSFFEKHDFKAYISYHSSGNLLYYYHHQSKENEKRDYNFAQKISSVTNYYIMPPQKQKGSGTSTDWFIMHYKKPGITMEISSYVGDRPVPISHYADIWNRNKTIGLLAAKESQGF